MIAFLGFSGEEVCGTLTLMGPVALMRHAYPLPVQNEQLGDAEVFDWAGEVVNRLLGRIKHVLASRGVQIRSSTPQVVRGEQMNVWPSRRGKLIAVRFVADPWWIGVWFEVTTPGATALLHGPVTADAPPEGEVILF
ncbi:MAG TPA: chemotaxis protein CheX [Polyangiaceae bacterium]|nr:chemotaxis protein CheX [Polyangiaceae bacterium]